MANPEKAEVKIGVYRQEIESLESEMKNIKQQEYLWRGYEKAHKEGIELFNALFRTIRDAMEWNKLTDEEREERSEKKEGIPALIMTDAEGERAAMLMRPALTVLTNKAGEAAQEPAKFQAQYHLLGKQIERFHRLIKSEEDKHMKEFADDIPAEDLPHDTEVTNKRK